MLLKDTESKDSISNALLREYLIYSYPAISADFPEVAGIEPANAADYLIHLKNTGRIKIDLFKSGPKEVACRIVEADATPEPVQDLP